MPRNFKIPPRSLVCGTPRFNEAAADAAEFSSYVWWIESEHDPASMRPRQMPRNFSAGGRLQQQWVRRFNEAAADAAEFWTQARAPRADDDRLQ